MVSVVVMGAVETPSMRTHRGECSLYGESGSISRFIFQVHVNDDCMGEVIAPKPESHRQERGAGWWDSPVTPPILVMAWRRLLFCRRRTSRQPPATTKPTANWMKKNHYAAALRGRNLPDDGDNGSGMHVPLAASRNWWDAPWKIFINSARDVLHTQKTRLHYA